MPLGWCEDCDSLKPITTLGLKLGSRECEWAPVSHDRERHVACGSVARWVEFNNEDYTGPYWVLVCTKCGELPGDSPTILESCPGSRKPIR